MRLSLRMPHPVSGIRPVAAAQTPGFESLKSAFSSHYRQTANFRYGLVPAYHLLGKLPLSLEAGWMTADGLTAATPSKDRESRQGPITSR